MMTRHLMFLFPLALMTLPVVCLGQPQSITDQTTVSSNQIQRWLSSGDPRLVAWGAHFAEKQDCNDSVPAMAQFAERWVPFPPDHPIDWDQRFQEEAMGSVLDALIVCHGEVSVAAVASISRSFPAQAAILASRLPLSASTPLLITWYGGRSHGDLDSLARIAAMMLSKAPPPGFAFSIIDQAEVHLVLMVVSQGGMGGGSGGSACGDGFDGGQIEGWPELFAYHLEENNVLATSQVAQV